MQEYQAFFIAGFGAICQEVVHLHQLSRAYQFELLKQQFENQIEKIEVRPFYANWWCWLISIAMISCTAIAVWWLYKDKNLPESVLFFLGAGFPAILKKVQFSFSDGKIVLGKAGSWRDYFRIN